MPQSGGSCPQRQMPFLPSEHSEAQRDAANTLVPAHSPNKGHLYSVLAFGKDSVSSQGFGMQQ